MDLFVPTENPDMQLKCRICGKIISTLFYTWQDEVCESCWRTINEENGKLSD